jgi:hypothetical protein
MTEQALRALEVLDSQDFYRVDIWRWQIISPTQRPPFPFLEVYLLLTDALGWVDPRALVRQEGII